MSKVLELRGPRSLGALNVFSTLILGLKMLPMYAAEGYEDFLNRLEKMPRDDQEKMLREALQFVNLKPEEIEAIGCFYADPNGVPYSQINIRNLSLKDTLEMIIEVCLEVVGIAVDFINNNEKKKSQKFLS